MQTLMKPFVAAAALLACAAPASAADDVVARLEVGSPMPPLSDVAWLKGGPVQAWEPGQVYVIDFWATWCGPCKATMPHVNGLARQYRDRGVTVIGAAIWPRKGMVPTDEFVARQGDEMDYLVAEDVEGRTAATFMKAAGRNGIPTVMVVDQRGTLAFMGHPTADPLDEVLERIVAGSFDPLAFEAERKERAETSKRLTAQLKAATEAEQWERVAELAAQLIALDPRRNGAYARLRYQALLSADLLAQAAALGRELVGGAWAADASSLNTLAWSIVAPDSPVPDARRDLELAALAADRANELAERRDASILDTVARVRFLQGDLQAAVLAQKAAVDAATSERERASLAETLAAYAEALEAQG